MSSVTITDHRTGTTTAAVFIPAVACDAAWRRVVMALARVARAGKEKA